MILAKIAGLKIRIRNKYDYIENRCKEYIISEDIEDFEVAVTDDEILAEGDPTEFSIGYLEYLAIYRKIAEKIIEHDGLLIHGVLMECDKRGILLCAKSGVGKSTHAALWLKRFGDRCKIVNGDKPLVRIFGGEIFAYGTPWNGKEGLHINKKCKLSAICFLERSDENFAEPMGKDAILKLLTQTYMPKNSSEKTARTLELLDEILRGVKCVRLGCNMDISAAQVAYEELMK